MSAVQHAARAAAAVFVLGLSMATAPAVAFADSTGTAASEASDSAPDTSAGTTAGPNSPGARRATRSPAATGAGAAPRRATSAQPAAARAESVDAAAGLDVPISEPSAMKTRPQRRERPVSAPAAQADRTSAPRSAPLESNFSIPAAIPDSPAAIPVEAPGTGSGDVPITAAANVVATEPTPVPAASAAAMVAATGTAAATSVADLFTDLLAPIREFFEGAALLVRRTFFNQAPTLDPIQLTGQSEGTITGVIGAVDPEGDPLVYSISQAPRYGSAVVDTDGTYTYTPGPGFTGIDSFIVEAADTGFHINLLDLFRAAGTSANVAVAQGASIARVQFEFVYRYGAQFWSSEARAALESVATTLSTYLVVDSPVTVTFDVTGESSSMSATLASAGSDLVGSDPGFLRTVVQNKILTGADANGADADGTISWNFGRTWDYGRTVADNQYDFQSTAMHELLHTLGFLSNTDRPGANTGLSWTVFDSYLVTSGGTAVIGGDYRWNSAYNTNMLGGSGGLYFGGPNAVAAYGGPVPLYTPSPWDAGSSISHLDDRTFTGSNQNLMNAVVDLGRGVRIISPVEVAILEDLGYTLTPGTGSVAWALIGVVFIRRRRRRD